MADVVVAMVSDTFSDSVRRGFYSTADQTILSLVADERIDRVLVVDHPRGILSQLSRRVRGDRPAARASVVRGVRPLVRSTSEPADWKHLRKRYAAYAFQIRAAAAWHGLKRPAVVSFNALFSAALTGDWYSKHVFYAQDDEQEIPRLERRRCATRMAYDLVSEHADEVVAVTAELANRIGRQGGAVIPNGVDADFWLRARGLARTKQRRPMGVYVGTVDARIDVSTIQRVASAIDVTIVGPLRDDAIARDLRKIPGVSLSGGRTREQVRDDLLSADVGLLLHQRTPLTDAMSPLKFFEYRAAGLPIVASSLKGVCEVASSDELVWDDDFEGAVTRALSRGRSSEEERVSMVREMSWLQRHAILIDQIV